MKTLYVKDLVPGSSFRGETFAVVEKKVSVDRNGQPFYDLVLADKTGEVSAKIWGDVVDSIDKKIIKQGNVVAIDANIGEYKGRVQLSIVRLNAVDETKLEDYVTSSSLSSDDMWDELIQIIDQDISNEHLLKMLRDIFADSEVSRKFKYWPAANSYHHEFRSGLLQHTLECLALVAPLKRFYPDVDYNIVRAALILHDIGKIEELDASGMVTRYTVKGSALSHVYIGTEYVDKYLPQEAPESLSVHLKHIILSHNGDKEKGAPAVPITIEAAMVSTIDETSSMINQFEKGMKLETDERGMTDYNRWLNRSLWTTRNSESIDPKF